MPALFTSVAAGLIGLRARCGKATIRAVRDELLALVLAWVILPVFAAVPLMLLTPGIGVRGAIFEMVAALTTTGGTVYGDPETLAPAIHLWRGLVGWIGGVLTLTAAWAVLAPRRLGGFEVEAATWRIEDAGRAHATICSASRPRRWHSACAVRCG